MVEDYVGMWVFKALALGFNLAKFDYTLLSDFCDFVTAKLLIKAALSKAIREFIG